MIRPVEAEHSGQSRLSPNSCMKIWPPNNQSLPENFWKYPPCTEGANVVWEPMEIVAGPAADPEEISAPPRKTLDVPTAKTLWSPKFTELALPPKPTKNPACGT